MNVCLAYGGNVSAMGRVKCTTSRDLQPPVYNSSHMIDGS